MGILDLYRATPGPLSSTGFRDAVTLAHVGAQAVLALSGQAAPDGFPGDLTDTNAEGSVSTSSPDLRTSPADGAPGACVRRGHDG